MNPSTSFTVSIILIIVIILWACFLLSKLNDELACFLFKRKPSEESFLRMVKSLRLTTHIDSPISSELREDQMYYRLGAVICETLEKDIKNLTYMLPDKLTKTELMIVYSNSVGLAFKENRSQDSREEVRLEVLKQLHRVRRQLAEAIEESIEEGEQEGKGLSNINSALNLAISSHAYFISFLSNFPNREPMWVRELYNELYTRTLYASQMSLRIRPNHPIYRSEFDTPDGAVTYFLDKGWDINDCYLDKEEIRWLISKYFPEAEDLPSDWQSKLVFSQADHIAETYLANSKFVVKAKDIVGTL